MSAGRRKNAASSTSRRRVAASSTESASVSTVLASRTPVTPPLLSKSTCILSSDGDIANLVAGDAQPVATSRLDNSNPANQRSALARLPRLKLALFDVDVHGRPGTTHGLLLVGANTVQVPGHLKCRLRRRLKGGLPPQALRERNVPDLPCLFPCVATDLHRGQVEGMVGNPGINVNAAVIGGRVYVVTHACGLRVLAEHGVVISCAGFLHGTERLAFHARREETLPDQPVGLVSRLSQPLLLHERTEHV